MKAVIEAGFEEGVRRDPTHQAEWVALVDGDPTQIELPSSRRRQSYGVTVVIILDIIHVLEYLWKARPTPCSTRSERPCHKAIDRRGVRAVVADRIEQLLQGQRPSLVLCLRRAATVKG